MVTAEALPAEPLGDACRDLCLVRALAEQAASELASSHRAIE